MLENKKETVTVYELKLRSLDNPKAEPQVVLICAREGDAWELMQFAFDLASAESVLGRIENLIWKIFLGKEKPYSFKKDYPRFGKFIPPENFNEGYTFRKEVSLAEFEELKKNPLFIS